MIKIVYKYRWKINLILLVVTMLLITACSSGDEQHTLDLDFHKGTKGIEFDVLGIMNEVYEGTSFKVALNVFNKGAYDLPNTNGGYINLNLEKDYMCFSDGQKCINTNDPRSALRDLGDMKGKSVLNPTGDFDVFEYYIMTKKIDKQSFEHISTIGLSLCYQYQTDLITDACIDPYFYEQSQIEKPCVVKDLSFSSQGSPLVITKIESKMLSDGQNKVKPMFIIHVLNNGRGEVIHKDMVDQVCTAASLPPNAFNTVHLREFEFMIGDTLYKYDRELENKNLKCDFLNNKEETKLNEGKAKIRCTALKPIGPEIGTITTQLKMVFDYGYTYSESKSIAIKRLY
jgi:hypothetical protein